MGPVAKTRVGMTAVATETVRRQVITTGQARAVIDAEVIGPAAAATRIDAIPVAVAANAGAGPAALGRAVGVRSGRRGAIATTIRVADRDPTAVTDLPAVATTAAARGAAVATTAVPIARAARGTATATDVGRAPAAIGRAKAAAGATTAPAATTALVVAQGTTGPAAMTAAPAAVGGTTAPAARAAAGAKVHLAVTIAVARATAVPVAVAVAGAKAPPARRPRRLARQRSQPQ